MKEQRAEKPKLAQSRLRNNQIPKPTTYLTRQYAFLNWLERHLGQHPPDTRLKVLVAGIGGGDHPEPHEEQVSAEHLELGLLLHRLELPFELTAMDISREAILRAKEQLANRAIEAEELFYTRMPSEPGFQEYARRLKERVVTPRDTLSPRVLILPASLKDSIRIQGPGAKGDVTGPHLPQSNDVITAFNLSMYFDPENEMKLADRLVDSLREGGIIATNTFNTQKNPFIRALRKRLGARNHIATIPNPHGNGDFLVFQKARRWMPK